MLLSVALFASEPVPTTAYSKRYEACSERAEGSYTHIIACQGEELVAQEARLNRTYSALMRRLTRSERRKLRLSERKWLKARDKTCALPRNAALSQLVDSRECRLDETLRRIGWLERYR